MPTATPARASLQPVYGLWAAAMLLLLGCSSGRRSEPESLPPQTVTQVAPQLEPPPQQIAPAPVRDRPMTPDTKPKVIDEGGDPRGPVSLIEASRLAKEQKKDAAAPIAEITDENLHEYAEGGEVIILESAPAAPPVQLRSPEGSASPDDESYWKNTALELRMSWRRSLDRIDELELENAALRQQFYAEEDVYIRDNQIKPAWDRVLDRLDSLREEATRYEEELEVFLEAGHREGADPGWLREGWELEPTDEERQRLDRSTPTPQAVEPQTIEPGREGGG